jgi:hypothetical protein
MSDRKITSSFSRVTLRIFYEVFLHIVDMFSDCTFWDRKDSGGKTVGGGLLWTLGTTGVISRSWEEPCKNRNVFGA